MEYINLRTKEVQAIHQVYNEKILDTIKSLLNAQELLHLNMISQSCGIRFSSFNMFSYPYTKLDHCVGVALILDKFISDNKQIFAGLIHDIASPAFAYAITVEKDELTKKIYEKVVSSDVLFDYCLQNQLPLHEVTVPHTYPLVCNEVPKLCANCLEYLLHGAYFTKLCTIDEIKELYNDITIVPNEENIPEFAFDTPSLGINFCKISLEMGKRYRSYEFKIILQIISDLLRLMIERDEITNDDLYKFGDRAILEMGISSSDKRISEGWKKLSKLDKIYTRFTPLEGEYCKKVITKSQYVDPLIRVRGGYTRASSFSEECRNEINLYLNTNTELYAYVLGFQDLLGE